MNTTVGIPKELKVQENRVSCTPSMARALVNQNNRVLIETGAGLGSGYNDEKYLRSGATIMPDADSVFEEADLILKVKEPVEAEFNRFHEGQTLFTYLHLAANHSVAQMLVEKSITSFAYENVEMGNRRPLLEPMSEIAGRMSALVGAYYLSSAQGGSGVLPAGVPGVLPGKVLILGGGISGVNAARMAKGLGADVTIMELSVEKMREIDNEFHSEIKTIYSSQQHLQELVPQTDLLIGAVLIPGARAPKLLDRNLLSLMKPGSVFVDIAIDQGGCSETSTPTTHADPVYHVENVLHYCVSNMPGAYARSATQALTHVTMPYVLKLAALGPEKAAKSDQSLAVSLNTRSGKITHPTVAAEIGVSVT